MGKTMSQKIEELSLTCDKSDLWDELSTELSPPMIINTFPSNTEVRLRLLGPFVHSQRWYIPYFQNIKSTNVNLDLLLEREEKTIETVRKILLDKEAEEKKNGTYKGSTAYSSGRVDPLNTLLSNQTIAYNGNRNAYDMNAYVTMNSGYSKSASELLTHFNKLVNFPNYPKWQGCILVNAFVKVGMDAPRIKVMCLTGRLCSQIGSINNLQNITGIYAHDLSFTKRGQLTNISYDIVPHPMNSLSKREIEIVLNYGLYDIPKIIMDNNKNKRTSYYYKQPSSYKMSSELMKDLKIPEAKEKDEHMEEVEEHLNDIPRSVLGLSERNAINSLEVDEGE